MKCRFKSLIMASVLMCLLLAVVAPASYTTKILYIDGQYALDVNVGDALDFPTELVRVASEGGDGYMYNEYLGDIDEFAIYAGILDAARIKAHYDANDSNTAYTAEVQYDNPLLWLRFHDADLSHGATAENSGSSLTDGEYRVTDSGFTLTDGIAESNALSCPYTPKDQSEGHRVEVPDNGEFGEGLDGAVTVECWVRYTDIGTDYMRFYTTGNVGGYGLHINTGEPNGMQWVIHGGGENYVFVPVEVNDGQWHHLVVTYESVYEEEPCPDTNSYVEEVNDDNPVLWLRFEDEEPKDYSAHASNRWVDYGTAASIVDGVGGIGKSVRLSGADGDGVYGVAATNNANEPPYDDVNETYEIFGDQYAFAPNDVTFELWYKTFPSGETQPAQFAWLFQQHGAWDSGPPPYDVNNEFRAPAAGNGGGQVRISGGSDLGYTGINPKFDGEWHHMVVTYDEEYEGDPNQLYVELYIDGKFKNDALFTTDTNTPYSARLGPELSHILLGAENDIGNTYNAFAGYMDEFAIYEGILDPNRVKDHYCAWKPKNCADMWARGQGEPVDINRDCKIDFADIAGFALNWRTCNDPCDPNCVPPNW